MTPAARGSDGAPRTRRPGAGIGVPGGARSDEHGELAQVVEPGDASRHAPSRFEPRTGSFLWWRGCRLGAAWHTVNRLAAGLGVDDVPLPPTSQGAQLPRRAIRRGDGQDDRVLRIQRTRKDQGGRSQRRVVRGLRRVREEGTHLRHALHTLRVRRGRHPVGTRRATQSSRRSSGSTGSPTGTCGRSPSWASGPSG